MAPISPPRRRPARPAPIDPADGARSAAEGSGADARSAGAPRGSFGQWLRGQREARAVELAEIAEESKISLRYLTALEQDRFDILPAPVFVRGFLREYARVVGLDADEVVNLFLVSAPRATPERRPDTALSSGSQSFSDSSGSSFGRGLVVAVAVIFVLGLAAAVAYWATQRATPSANAAPPSTAQAPQEASNSEPMADAAATPKLGESAPALASTVELAPAGPVPVNPPETTLPAAAPLVPAPISSAPQRPLVVVLAFQQDCWVESRIDGGRRTSELRAGGETLTLEADESIVLTLGNAPAVKAELNGLPLAFPIDASRLLREFRIDRSLIAEPSVGERRPASPETQEAEPSQPEQPSDP